MTSVNVDCTQNFQEMTDEFVIKDKTKFSLVFLFVIAIDPRVNKNLNASNSSAFLVIALNLFIYDAEP